MCHSTPDLLQSDSEEFTSGDEISHFCYRLVRNDPLLTELYLRDKKIGDYEATAFAAALQGNTQLPWLDLAENEIGDHGAIAIASVLQSSTTLQVLNLSANIIGFKGAMALAAALETNTTLQDLVVSRNLISVQGAMALAKSLERNSTLQRICLDDNMIGVEGAQGLAKALETNVSLQCLSLSSNSIGDEGAMALAKALQFNSTLQELHIQSNRIGDMGVAALSMAFESNVTLLTITLCQNEIRDKGALALANALLSNSSIKELDLSDNVVGDNGLNALLRAVEGNATMQDLKLSREELDCSEKPKGGYESGRGIIQKATLSPHHSRNDSKHSFNSVITDLQSLLVGSVRTMSVSTDPDDRVNNEMQGLPKTTSKDRTVFIRPDSDMPGAQSIVCDEGTDSLADMSDFDDLGRSSHSAPSFLTRRSSIANSHTSEDIAQVPLEYSNGPGKSVSSKHAKKSVSFSDSRGAMEWEPYDRSDDVFRLPSTQSSVISGRPMDNENDDDMANVLLILGGMQPILSPNPPSVVPRSINVSKTSMPGTDASTSMTSTQHMVLDDTIDVDSFMKSSDDLVGEIESFLERGNGTNGSVQQASVEPAIAPEQVAEDTVAETSDPLRAFASEDAQHMNDNGHPAPAPRELEKSNAPPAQDPSRSDPTSTNPASFSPSEKEFRYVSRDAITDKDVLFDHKDVSANHPGTTYFRDIVMQWRSKYEPLCFLMKARMVSTILGELSQRGRFIRRIGQGPYFLMTEEDARVVLSEALRDNQSLPPSCSSDLPVLTMPPKSAQAIGLGETDSVVVTPPSSGSMLPSVPFVNAQMYMSPSKTERIYVSPDSITDKDVLCGREFRETSHPGNHFYLQTVASQKDRHRSLGSKHGEKTKIRNMIVDEVVGSGGRFVKKEGDRFYLLTQAEARAKVGQSLRDNKRKAVANQ